MVKHSKRMVRKVKQHFTTPLQINKILIKLYQKLSKYPEIQFIQAVETNGLWLKMSEKITISKFFPPLGS